MSSRRKVRFAVIGAGMIGDVHAQALTDLSDTAELTVIADIDGSKAAAMAEKVRRQRVRHGRRCAAAETGHRRCDHLQAHRSARRPPGGRAERR